MVKIYGKRVWEGRMFYTDKLGSCVAITNYHTFCKLKKEILSSSSGGQKSGNGSHWDQVKGQQHCVPSGGSRAESVSCFF